MICSENGERREEIVKPCCAVVIVPGFQVHSALYGDGKERYADVTSVVKDWVSKQSWPDNWEEILYAQRKPRAVGRGMEDVVRVGEVANGEAETVAAGDGDSGLHILSARYGVLGAPVPFREHSIDVTERVRSLVKNGSLDIVVNNSTLTPNENPYRGKKKVLLLSYNYGDSEQVTVEREEKDWLIIGPVQDGKKQTGIPYVYPEPNPASVDAVVARRESGLALTPAAKGLPMTAVQLNDYLIRRFSISPQRLRGPMPIELRDFHRNDLAQLFAELGFKKGCEVGVAEGHFSEILLKANPDLELLLVDPWHHYSDNPQGKSPQKHAFAFEETKRRTAAYPNVKIVPKLSMDAVRDIPKGSLDFSYIDGAHSFNYVLMDIIEWSQRVRNGGMIALDDYFFIDRKRWGAGVVEAVQAFTSAHQVNPWFICDAHRSVDAFWVNP